MLGNVLKIVTGASLTLPAMEVSLLLAALSCCLVFKLTRTGLIIAYLFVYRWGWLLMSDQGETYMAMYLGLGLIIGIITFVGLVREHPDK